MSEITKMFAAIEFLRKRLSKGMPSQHVTLLLAVSENPGITMPELCQLLDMPQGTVSRNVKVLSHYVERLEGNVLKSRGYGLLRTQPDSHSSHSLAVYLTGKGQALVQELEQVLRSGRTTRERHEGNDRSYAASHGISMMH